MSGTVSEEIEINVPASEAWKVYGTLQFAKIASKVLDCKVEVVQGDGSAGTILEIFSTLPGKEGLRSYKEKFTVVDDEKRVKVAEIIEGGYLDLGFSLFRIRIEVIEKEGIKNQCVARLTVEHQLKEEAAPNSAALVTIQPLMLIMKAAADYALQNYKNN